jgi:hypothetical protein
MKQYPISDSTRSTRTRSSSIRVLAETVVQAASRTPASAQAPARNVSGSMRSLKNRRVQRIATQLIQAFSGKDMTLKDVVRELAKKASSAYVGTGGKAPERITMDLDDVLISFRFADDERKVFFRQFAGNVVGVIIGSHLAPKFGGKQLLERKPILERIDDLNILLRK